MNRDGQLELAEAFPSAGAIFRQNSVCTSGWRLARTAAFDIALNPRNNDDDLG
jgi:hypothetical protein